MQSQLSSALADAVACGVRGPLCHVVLTVSLLPALGGSGRHVLPVHVAGAPRCAEDGAVLAAARGLSRATVTTGRNLRMEQSWDWSGFRADATLAVLTRRAPPALPTSLLCRDRGERSVLLCVAEEEQEVQNEQRACLARSLDAVEGDAEVVSLSGGTGLTQALLMLQGRFPGSVLSVEAGPSTVMHATDGLFANDARFGGVTVAVTTCHGAVPVDGPHGLPRIEPEFQVPASYFRVQAHNAMWEAKSTSIQRRDATMWSFALFQKP